MNKDQFTLTQEFTATPAELYKLWMTTEGHTAMTGAEAKIKPQIGTSFKAWDGYIWGKILDLKEGKHILLSWRTSEFSDKDADSILEITLEENGVGTLLTLNHKHIPEGQGEQYKTGWTEHYFDPMKAHLSK